MPAKNYFLNTIFSACYFLKVQLHYFSKIKSQKESQNCRIQDFSYYFCMMIEGSGSIPLTSESESGSGKQKNTWIWWIWIRIRIRIRNTGLSLYLEARIWIRIRTRIRVISTYNQDSSNCSVPKDPGMLPYWSEI